jgi:hypothetical protein
MPSMLDRVNTDRSARPCHANQPVFPSVFVAHWNALTRQHVPPATASIRRRASPLPGHPPSRHSPPRRAAAASPAAAPFAAAPSAAASSAAAPIRRRATRRRAVVEQSGEPCRFGATPFSRLPRETSMMCRVEFRSSVKLRLLLLALVAMRCAANSVTTLWNHRTACTRRTRIFAGFPLTRRARLGPARQNQ